MANLLSRLRGDSPYSRLTPEQRYSVDMWLTDYLFPANEGFTFGGASYPIGLSSMVMSAPEVAELASTLPSYSAAVKSCPPAFAAQNVRARVMSQARFTYRNLAGSATPKRTFGTRDLAVLEQPWPGATTGELLARMEWHVGLAGNSYVYRAADRLRVLRPDWTGIVYGSQREPDDPSFALDSELLGYVYVNGGWFQSRNDPVTLPASAVAHWSPLPDPEAAGLGMSWITPALREIQGDKAATEHKLRFFSNGATPNLVVNGIRAPAGQELTEEQFRNIVGMLDRSHTGVHNAYRTLYLTEGADAKVIGSDLQQLDFKNTQGAGETRIAFLSQVPAAILNIAEGLAGSSLNAGNLGQSRRNFADTFVFPQLQDVCAALATIVAVPGDAELWFDVSDIPLLREDAKDAADIFAVLMQAIRTGVDGGFDPQTVIAAAKSLDVTLLKHTGKLSVQLQEPGAGELPASPAA